MSIDLDLEYKDYYAEDLYMVADVETGVLYNRSGRRMLALTDDFLIGFHRAIEKQCGDRASQVLHTCGRKWGYSFGHGLAAEWSEFYGRPFRSFPLALFQSLLVQEFANNGWGILRLDYSRYAEGILCIHLQGAIMASIRSQASESPADLLTAGIIGGMYSYFVNRELDCLQTQCLSKGFQESRFVVSSEERIRELRKLLRNNMPHDQVIDELSKIAAA